MFRSFYIQPHERGLLFYRSDFHQVLLPGIHRRWGWRWQVQTYDLNQPVAEIANLELLLQSHTQQFEDQFTIVRTAFNEAALVRVGPQWQTVAPNQLKAFWKGFIEVEVQIFNLDQEIELPSLVVRQLRGQSLAGLKFVHIAEAQMGMLYEQDNFVRPLLPGDYGFWTCDRKLHIPIFDRTQPNPDLPQPQVLMDQHPEFVSAHCQAVHLSGTQVAIARFQGKVIAILPPHSHQLFWQDVTVDVIDISTTAKLPAPLVAELISGLPEVLNLAYGSLHVLEVEEQHLGLLYNEGALIETLSPGHHAWWVYGRSYTTEIVDLRLQTLEVSGQEILSKDKVSLRLNLSAGYRIHDPVQAKATLSDIESYLYKELQFALRAAVGTKTLDALLEDKSAIDNTVADYMLTKVAEQGITLESVGVKDIILPGEMKAILGQVVEAEKSAQANVIRRREETAATRSMLNTAKVMENNPVALRLKELELLERIADKIEKINVNGSLDNILTDIIQIDRS